MKIILNRLSLRNFKGIKEHDIDFNHITNIYGENAAGKTTVFDAFCWLLFGKDSENREKFEIKTLDKHGKTNPKTECEVTGHFAIDGQPVVFRKALVENWVKPKGQIEAVLKGNDTSCFINDVPQKVGVYNAEVDKYCNEGVFKLITNPLYFNSMKWQDQRNILGSIAGNVTNSEVAANNPDFQALVEAITGKTLEGYKTELSAKKRKLKEQLQLIPARIDEVNKSMPEAIDEKAINAEISILESVVENIETQMNDANESYNQAARSQQDLRNHVNAINTQIQSAEFAIKQKFNTDRNDRKIGITNAENELNSIISANSQFSNSKTRIDGRISNLEQQRLTLRKDWEKVNGEIFSFDSSKSICPTCKRELDADKIESQKSHLENNFNTDKQTSLASIANKGVGLSTEIEGLKNELQQLSNGREFDKELATAQSILHELKINDSEANRSEEVAIETAIKNNPEIFTLRAQRTNLQAQIDTAQLSAVDNTELKIQRQQKQRDLDTLKATLNNKEAIDRAHKRIEELEQQEKTQGQELADLERTEFTIAQFTKAKIDLIEGRINGKFKLVTFKMYDKTIEGNDVETCQAMVSGVPYSNANNAAKINAGLDIINALCDHYKTWAPIFIDNRESVNNLIDCESPLVNLIVSFDKKLKIA